MEKREPPSYSAWPGRSNNNNREKQELASTSASTTTNTDTSISTEILVPTFQTKFASLSLHQNDKLRLLDFPDEAAEVIKLAISTGWPHGLQEHRTVHNSLELKLKGHPWLGLGTDSMHARRLMRQIFHHLFDAGWILSLSTDVSKKTRDKDTLIFRYQSPPPKPRDWICVAFSKKDRLRLMDAPIEVTNAVHEQIRDQIQEIVAHPLPGVWEAKLKGWPWSPLRDGEDVMNTRRLLLRLFAILENHGFTVYASIDQKADIDSERSETDTWHCCRLKDWERGAPVYHA